MLLDIASIIIFCIEYLGINCPDNLKEKLSLYIQKHDLNIVSVTDYLKQTTINDFDLVELQKPIFVKGERVYDDPDIMEKQTYCNEQMKTLYPEIKRTNMPSEYYVDGTEEYVNFKNDLIQKTRKRVK